MSETEWHYLKDGRQWGPVTTAELHEMLAEGHVYPVTCVRRAESADWRILHEVPELFEMPAPQPVLPADGSVVLAYRTPEQPQHRYASFGRRFGAFFIDYLIVGIVLNVGDALLNWAGIGGRAVDSAATALAIIAVWLYAALTESSARQGTLGKQALGLIVTDDHGRRITFGRATARIFAKGLSFATMYIGFLMAAFTKRNRALHDMLAGTLVLRS